MITAEQIKQLRSITGWTQKDLADRLGVSLKTITNYETGGSIPKGKSVLLHGMLENAKISISGNTGGINTGSVGGHNVNLHIPEKVYPKIINDKGIEITCESELNQEAQQYIKELENKIRHIESSLNLANERIELLEEKLTFKDEIISKLRNDEARSM